MKILLTLFGLTLAFYGCESGKSTIEGANNTESQTIKNDTIHIANEELEYEIIIIEPGFNAWLMSQPPRNFNGVIYLESKNRRYVYEYNRRVQDIKYNRRLYTQEIDYDSTIHYGLEVNYLLFNYFKYFEKQYKQNLK
ncbi:MAG: hypothetical protein ACI9SJ_000669 [Flavobacteriaceae bacterium]|jgi:hypothetical protein|uniref:DUF6146 family protein n=1 Tax=Candidatus Marifrigoribacter sp. Uisw_064 TaxID=3230970 RepID=UPI003AEEEE6F